MVNSFSVDYVGLYVNYTNISLFTILGKISNLASTYESSPFVEVAIFSDVMLVSN